MIGPLPGSYPHSGVCGNCGRERDDLFWHADDEEMYCADVFRCEARLEIANQRRLREEGPGVPPWERMGIEPWEFVSGCFRWVK